MRLQSHDPCVLLTVDPVSPRPFKKWDTGWEVPPREGSHATSERRPEGADARGALSSYVLRCGAASYRAPDAPDLEYMSPKDPGTAGIFAIRQRSWKISATSSLGFPPLGTPLSAKNQTPENRLFSPILF